ncbi:DUF4384 domain-containing protein [Sulfitobacter sp. BDSS02]|nr:DUF4384 domain-containing protein [Sulfitobacter sp. BDSS02]MBR9850144.1 DUF4384 domain-containing protein [Paracoccaceae bacterium]
MKQAALWTAGFAASLVFHAGAGAALMIALRPDPIDDQPRPQTEMQVESYALDRSEATEAHPDAPEAPAETAEGDRLGSGTIPQSAARPAEPPSGARLSAEQATAAPLAEAETPAETALLATPEPMRLGDSALGSSKVAATQAPVQRSGSLTPPEATSLPSATVTSALVKTKVATAEGITPAILPVQTTAAIQHPGTALASSSSPAVTLAALSANAPAVPSSGAVAQPISPATATTSTLSTAPATPDTVAALATKSAPLPESESQPDQIRATLAFPGGGDGIDPASLAAFESFMEPGDVTGGGDPLRDGVSALLAQVPCSRLQVSFDPETTSLTVKGHVPEGDLRAPVLAALRDQMGADITISDDILILPRPQCGALSGIGNVGLPQSTDQITNPLLIGEDTHARVLDFVKNERLFFDITAPDYAAYVYVDYFDADGNVLHLSPNNQSPLTRAEADTALRIGTASDEETGLRLFIGPPYGQEIAVAFAASEPLYDGLRPLVEPAAPYLDWLKFRVAEARRQYPDFKGEWVYFFVTTAEE